MNKLSRGQTIMRILLPVIALILVGRITLRPQNCEAESSLERFVQDQSKKNQPIRFDGIVQDENGSPVAGARIVISTSRNVPIVSKSIEQDDVELHSDQNGRFILENIVGTELKLRTIEKEGYEYSREVNRITTFIYVKGGVFHSGNIPVAFPFIYTIRKIPGGSVLLEGSYDMRLPRGKGESFTIDFAEDRAIRNGGDGDLRIRLLKTQDSGSTAEVVLEPLGERAGIIETPRPAYAAVREGYQSAHNLKFKGEGSEKRWYFLIRSRNFPLYSRLEITRVEHSDSVWVIVKSLTNPYGTTVLESLREAHAAHVTTAQREARRALAKDELPRNIDPK
jgi:hypothetical protein